MNTRRSKRSSGTPLGTGPTSDRPNYGEMPRPMENDDLSTRTSGSIASEVKESARTAGQAVGDQAMAFVTDLGEQVSKKVDDQKLRGVEAIRALAGAADTAAQQLEQQSPQVAGYVRDAAERVRDLSKTIEERDLSELLRNATNAARSNPVTFFAGAVLAGFALSRFLKSSNRGETLSANIGDGSDRTNYDDDSGGVAYGNP
jgi:ABC-type transporter Mla subunit MlaD